MLRKEFQPIDVDSLCRKARRLSGVSQPTIDQEPPLAPSLGTWIYRIIGMEHGQMTPVRVQVERRTLIPHR